VIANPVIREKQVEGAVILLMNVTEKVERENLRREFSANVSHELKTPLTSISGIAEIIQDGYVQPDDVKHFAGRIYKESQHL
ncbi:histidine kinase dimerization/phospho-acceptor domain-containing protein, partial [Acinetobacter baumannii]|nr:histidine kinase dimerization/phospho-acceptor domain-containing protein [Acinetobacter baumannii]